MRTPIVVVVLLLHSMSAAAQGPQVPADSGRMVRRARTLAMVEMPSVVGRSLEEAQQACIAARLRPTAVRIDDGAPTAGDIVVRQSPAAKQMVVIRTVCTLYVRPRPQDVQPTPDVLGLSRRAAFLLIVRAKLTPNVTMVPSPDTALGSVVAQNPLPRTPIRPDRTIDLQIAGVPRVVGLAADAAVAALERAHLTSATTIRELTTGTDGAVVEQFPEAGQPADSGSSVALTVVRVVEPRFAMPDLVGRPIDEARRIVADTGLVLQGLEIAAAEGRPDTTVGQVPAAGSLVRRGDPVTLTNGRPITVVPLVAVPDFVGARIDGVPRMPGADSLLIVASYAAPSRESGDSVVVAQSLAAGVRVPIGSTIALTVSQRAATSVVPDDRERPQPPPRWPWWWIPAIAAVIAALGLGAWRLIDRPDPPPTPPSTPQPVPPPAFSYDLEAPSFETEITATHGHGSDLSLVSHAGESDHALEPEGVELFNEESTHG